uniref:Uncharacterized protein n=1 Tax=Mus spicilegus TaxID=10103 RepID=A0A8C6I1Q1_MUSSI
TRPAAGDPAAAAAPAPTRAPAQHGHQVRGCERRGCLLPAPLAPLFSGRLLPRHGPRAATIGDSRPSLQQQNPASVAAGAAVADLASLPVPARFTTRSFWRRGSDAPCQLLRLSGV